ncbi:MAG: hypothetical protein HC859_05570 [Bacteroidia bacterium]|nr:hypothetical protein [Bacteroidia bacterium]
MYKIFSLAIACATATLTSGYANAQQQDTVALDSVTRHKIVSVAPHQRRQDTRSLGYLHYALDNRVINNNAIGLPVYFNLSGQVPGGQAHPAYSGYWQYNGLATVVDGVANGSYFGAETPLNNFDYEPALLLRNITGASMYGASVHTGALVLQSKTGEGHNRPTLDFNSNSFYTWRTGTDLNGDDVTFDQWNQSTSIAYSQDFGMIDTRVSYNHNTSPFNNDASDDYHNNRHTFTVNAGLAAGDVFKARVLVQDSRIKLGDDYNNQKNNYFTTSLRLQADPTRWLTITSLLSLQKSDKSYLQTYYPFTYYMNGDADQRRTLGNLFVSSNALGGEAIKVVPYAGIQLEKIKLHNEQSVVNNNVFNYSESTSEFDKTSLIAGVDAAWKETVYLGAGIRSERPSYLPEGNEEIVFANASFVFSDLFKASKAFSFGRFRSAFTHINHQQSTLFPYVTPYFIDSNATARKRRAGELGTDLGLFSDRINLNFTWRIERWSDQLVTGIPGGGGGQVIVNYEELETKTWEFVLDATIIRNARFQWNMAMMPAAYKTRLLGVEDGGGTPPIFIGSPTPDWTMSVRNIVQYRNLDAYLLVDRSQGGTYISIESPSVITSHDATYTRLKELSVAYRFVFGDTSARQLQLALVGRNLWYEASGPIDPQEAQTGIAVQKSISLSVTLGL